MNRQTLYNKIDLWIKEKGTKSFHWLYNSIISDSVLLNILNDNISENLINSPISQKIYHFYNDIKIIPKCRYCGKELKFITFVRPYIEFCDRECSKLDQIKNKETIGLKRKATNKEKYGVEFVMQNTDIKGRYIKNSIDKYGVDWVSKDPSVIKKIKDTWSNIDKDDIKTQMSNTRNTTIKERYGKDVTTSFMVPEIQEKVKNIMLEKYGVEYPYQSQEILDKGKKTNMERYGFENAMQNDDIQHKHFISCVSLKDYKLPSGKIVKIQGYANYALDELLKTYSEDDLVIEFDCPKIKYKMGEVDHFYRPDIYIKSENRIIEIKSIWILVLNLEKNVAKYRESLSNGYNIEYWVYTNDKKLMKFDFNDTVISNAIINSGIKSNNIDLLNIFYGSEYIFIPEKKLILHIQNMKNNNGMNDLLSLKNELITHRNGQIRLINIFFDLINDKPEIIISRINNLLSNTIKIHARKCKIKEITSQEAKFFLEATHIQGGVGSSVNLGLFYNDMLISVMTFGKKRIAMGQKVRVEGEYELLRFSSLLGHVVNGGASRLFKHFIKKYNPNVVITYADRNWSDGNLYNQLGFTKIHDTAPNYWYYKNGKRFHRFNFRKDVLVSNGHDKNKTEFQIMDGLGYNRIYDMGNIKYEMIIVRE